MHVARIIVNKMFISAIISRENYYIFMLFLIKTQYFGPLKWLFACPWINMTWFLGQSFYRLQNWTELNL